jgi:N-acetylneuraminate synthase
MIIKKPFLIGEIGINHNGDINLVKKLIDNAKKANFDAVKFQKRTIDVVYTEEFLNSYRESPWGNTQRDQKQKLEFSLEQYNEIDLYCREKSIEWFASAWDLQSLEFLKNFNLKYNKIASAMIVDKNFLEQVAKQKKYTFISTGISTEKNISDAVKIFRDLECPFELMHCVSTYPAKVSEINMSTLPALREKYSCNVGYSGHENGVLIAISSVILGATSIEKHITIDRTLYGSDQSASIELSGMIELSEGIDKILESYGKVSIGLINDSEKEIAKKLRAHIKY